MLSDGIVFLTINIAGSAIENTSTKIFLFASIEQFN